MTEEQIAVQQQTGIPDERFDPAFWSGRGPGSRPPDKIIWQTWSAEEKAASGFPDFAAWQAQAQSWRTRFQQGGDIWKKHRKQEAAILANRPQTEAQLRELLNSLGLFDQPDAGRARFRQLIGAFRGTNDLSGRYHFDPETGQIADMGTSDTTVRGVGRPATQHEINSLGQRSFLDQIADSLGVSNFVEGVRSGNTAVQGRDPDTGYLFNFTPTGEKQFFDDMGFVVDPATGERIGYKGGLTPDMEALLGVLNEGGPSSAGSLAVGGAGGAASGSAGGAFSGTPASVSGTPAGVASGPSLGSSDPLQGLLDLLGFGTGQPSQQKPFFQTFEQNDPMAALFPELRTQGFQGILGGINNPQIRAFRSGGFQVGDALKNLFPQLPAQSFNFGRPLPQISTDFIKPPPAPELPAPPALPPVPMGGQGRVRPGPRPPFPR